MKSVRKLLTFLSFALCGFSFANSVEVISAKQAQMPLLTDKQNLVATLKLKSAQKTTLKEVSVELKSELKNLDLTQVSVRIGKTYDSKDAFDFGITQNLKKSIKIKGNHPISEEFFVWIYAKTTQKPNLLNKISIVSVDLTTSEGKTSIKNFENQPQRFGISVRQKKQDACECYRIPGLATTKKGTLIAVYDNRYNNCKDLQEDVDVGMSRSTDGGQTWEPMKVIMDMKEWGGLSNQLNGIGDPAVLVDEVTGTIWVAALWLHGHDKDKMAWWVSKSGMTPQETGQFILVKSEDDGKTWSEPINITLSIKDPKWNLFFNGPGAGITLKDGTLVFAAQYKDEKAVPHSTLIYSQDRGKSWKVGVGAKSDTTEAQVVELSDGSIMLNMRDDRNRQNKDNLYGRSVATTKDFGKTWTEHPTSRKALIEPNCMASIIGYNHSDGKRYYFFSNPADANRRVNITIKASNDEAQTWDKMPQINLYADENFGYSCMSIVENKYIGILYEGAGDLYFQKIPISEFIK